MGRVIDLNADLGESFGNHPLGRDRELIPLLTSAHVACGFHGGDPRVMDETVGICRAAGVAVGAHPSLPDLVGFGRRAMDLTAREAETDVLYQVAALAGFCRRHGVTMQHVKPHGALYTQASADAELAAGVVAGIASFDPSLALVCQSGSELARAGEAAGLTVACEGFVDRGYDARGRLAPRRLEGAIYHDPERAVEQALRMVEEGTVVAMDGTVVELSVDTLCVHGDNPEAVDFIGLLRARLTDAGVALRPLREVIASRG